MLTFSPSTGYLAVATHLVRLSLFNVPISEQGQTTRKPIRTTRPLDYDRLESITIITRPPWTLQMYINELSPSKFSKRNPTSKLIYNEYLKTFRTQNSSKLFNLIHGTRFDIVLEWGPITEKQVVTKTPNNNCIIFSVCFLEMFLTVRGWTEFGPMFETKHIYG